MTLAEIRDKKLNCIIHTPLKSQVEVLIQEIPSAIDQGNAKRWIGYWDNCDNECCYHIVNGKIDGYCERGYYILHYRFTPIYEFSDLFATGGKIPTPSKPVPIKEQEGIFAEAKLLDLSVFCNAFPKEEEKMSTKFTFYTVDTSRINKTNNTKVDTIMTCVHIGDKVGYATCDKEDYDEREGILNAIANLCCDGSFDKAYRKAVKEKKISETLDRTCSYCRKVFDTVEERQEHEAWHVERRKARHERYLLRKRAKEIAFEEQAQKMAKEMMGEQK